MKNRTNLNQIRMIFLPTKRIKPNRFNEIFLNLLTKTKALQMNVNHNLQHESRNGGPGTYFT